MLENAPERILQFGEGNFLRAFCDYFVDIMNERCNFNSKIVICQPIASGLSAQISEQQGLYTLYLRGFENGQRVEQKRIISCISRCINPYEQYSALLDCAHNPNLRYIISNTTEAGIVFDDSCRYDDEPPAAFPAKLTRLLHERYNAGLSGLVMLSCELIDNNGDELWRCVEQYIAAWQLDAGFACWIREQNIFCSTLVDRIVTGYPHREADTLNAQNGYQDKLLVAGEVFGFWVIEGPESLRNELPFAQAKLPAIITDNHAPYKQRKVRILNGAHTTMVPAAFLAGKNTVRNCMDDPIIASFMKRAIFDEIIPTLTLPSDELVGFADAVVGRFKNPFIDHALLSIALNSTSKWRVRVLPSLKAYLAQFKRLPCCLTISMAAYITLYCNNKRGNESYTLADDDFVLMFFAAHKGETPRVLAQAVLANKRMWGEDLTALTGFVEAVAGYLEQIASGGIYQVLETAQEEKV